MQPLSLGVTVSGHVDRSAFVYYSYTDSGAASNASSPFNVTVTPSSSQDDPDLYVNVGQVPSLTLFVYSSQYSAGQVELVLVDPAQVCNPYTRINGTCTFYIGVYGFTASEYTVVAYRNDGAPAAVISALMTSSLLLLAVIASLM